MLAAYVGEHVNIRFILVEGPFKTSSTSVASEEPKEKQGFITEGLLFNC